MSKPTLPYLFRYENGPWADPVLFAPWLYARREVRLEKEIRAKSSDIIEQERKRFSREAIKACKSAARGRVHEYPSSYKRFTIKSDELISRFRRVAREWVVFPASFSLRTFSYEEYPDGYAAGQMLFLGALHRRDDLWMQDALEVARRALTYLPQSMRYADDSEQGIVQKLKQFHRGLPKPELKPWVDEAWRKTMTPSVYASKALLSRKEEALELHLTTNTHVGESEGIKHSPVLFETDPTGAVTEQRIAQNSREIGLFVDPKKQNARYKNKSYALSEPQSRLLRALLQVAPEWLSLRSIARGEERLDRHCRKLPEPILKLVESCQGKGTRLSLK